MLIVIAYSLGVPFMDNKVGGFMVGSMAPESGMQIRDRLTAINGEKVNTWEEVVTKVALIKDASQKVGVTVMRDGKDGKPTEHVLYVPLIQSGDKSLPPRLGILPYMPAVLLGERDDEEVLSAKVDGIKGTRRTPQGIVSLVKRHPGKDVTLTLKQVGGEVLSREMQVPSKKVFSSRFILMRAVVDVLPGKPAHEAGLRNGDEILSLNGKQIFGWMDLTKTVMFLRRGAMVSMGVRRKGEEMILRVKPVYDTNEERYVIGVVHSQEFKDRAREVSYLSPSIRQIGEGPKIGDKVIRIEEKKTTIEMILSREGTVKTLSLSKLLLPEETLGHLVGLGAPRTHQIRHAFPVALYKGIPQTGKELKEVLTFLKRLVTLKMSIKMLGGPVRIFEVSYFVKEHKGLAYFILLFAKIGISLAVLNMLPLPVLDGGHAVMVVLEMIRRRPLRSEVVHVIQITGFVLLLCLLVFVFYNDITNLMSR